MNATDTMVSNETGSLHMRAWTRGRRAARFLWRWGFGALMCMSPPGSIVAVGWALRRAGATARAEWADDDTPPIRPNWVVGAGGLRAAWLAGSSRGGLVPRARSTIAAAFCSLATNFRVGLSSLLTVWTVTLPGCVLWLFAWYDGWNNSFTKGYENAGVGPVTGLLGTALFIASMMYVPMAQARHAATGDWRTFFRFRIVWRLARQCRLRYLGLAALYAATALPVMVLKTAPMLFTQLNDAWEPISSAEAREILDGYFFKACLVVFPLFVLLRVVGARVYAIAARNAVVSGRIGAGELHPVEAEALRAQAGSTPRRRRGDRAVTVVWLAALAAIWFAFVAQIFVSEFLNYHPGVGWLNQPTAQAPWFHYMPAHLRK